MNTQTETRPASQRNDIEPMVHIVCCKPKRGLCGTRLLGIPADDEPTECVVCIELEEADAPCSRLCNLRTNVTWWLWRRWRK